MAITASSGTVKARTLSARGGRTVATPLRLVQSCKNLRSEPFAYISDVLDRVSTIFPPLPRPSRRY